LGLDRPVLRLYRTGLWLGGSGFRLYRAGLYRASLGLTGADLGLTRSYFRLAGTVWHRAGVWAGDAGLRGNGPRGCDHGRTALVDVVELLTVLRGFALVLNLGGHGRNARPAHGCDLSRLRANCDSTATAVVGDASVVVDDNCAVVDVGDVDIDAVDGAVVVEVVAVPVAAVITDAGVAEAVVNAAVEADVRAPEAAMEAPAVAVPAPVAGGPEGTVVGWSTPCAGDPVVAGGSPVPVAGGPEIVGRGGDGLFVDGERWRRLVGVFDGLGLAVGVNLRESLSVLIGLILIGGRSCLGWSGLFRILLGVLLGLSLRAGCEHLTLNGRGGGGCGRLWLAVVDGRHVGIGRIGAGVVGDG